MKFGLSFLPDSDFEAKSAVSYYEEALKLCETADHGGLHTIKMTEHYLHPYGGYCPSPLMFLSAVSSRTRRIRLMTGCILPAFHHPLALAAETAMLDAISCGRLDVGLARAYLPYEFDAFNVNLDDSRARYKETIQAMRQLWVDPKVSVETPFFSFKNATNYPQVTQRPHPPLWGAAVNSRESFAWLGEEGFGLLVSPPSSSLLAIQEKLEIYRESFNSKKSVYESPQVALSIPLYLAPTDSVAITECAYYLNRYKSVWADATQSWKERSSSAYLGYQGLGSIIRNLNPESMIQNSQAIACGPKAAIEKIHWIKESLQVDQILWQIDFGGQSYETSARTLDLFINEVLPSC